MSRPDAENIDTKALPTVSWPGTGEEPVGGTDRRGAQKTRCDPVRKASADNRYLRIRGASRPGDRKVFGTIYRRRNARDIGQYKRRRRNVYRRREGANILAARPGDRVVAGVEVIPRCGVAE